MNPVVVEVVEIPSLELKVLRHLSGRVRAFRVVRHADGLVLQGYAATYHAKQLAQHAVMQVTRLPILANEIEVGT
jgi:acetoacetate decarboxylase